MNGILFVFRFLKSQFYSTKSQTLPFFIHKGDSMKFSINQYHLKITHENPNSMRLFYLSLRSFKTLKNLFFLSDSLIAVKIFIIRNRKLSL